jgi:hypothetical protein
MLLPTCSTTHVKSTSNPWHWLLKFHKSTMQTPPPSPPISTVSLVMRRSFWYCCSWMPFHGACFVSFVFLYVRPKQRGFTPGKPRHSQQQQPTTTNKMMTDRTSSPFFQDIAADDVSVNTGRVFISCICT